MKPRHEKFSFQPADKLNRILLALSPDGRNGTALINQDGFFNVSKLEFGKSVKYSIHLAENGVYIHCATGIVTIGENELNAGNAWGVYETDQIEMKATMDVELIFVEVPLNMGIQP